MHYVIDSERQTHMALLCQRAIDLWGHEAQTEQAQEEMLELLIELQKIYRGRHNPADIIKELVDVYQCLHQLIYMYGEENFQAAFDEKMGKFERHLNRAHQVKGSGI